MKSSSHAYMDPGLRELLQKLGHDLQVERKIQRRRLADLARDACCSVGTLRRLEAGDPGVSIGVLASVMAQLHHAEALAVIVHGAGRISAGAHATAREQAGLPRRIRPRRSDTEWPTDENEAPSLYEDD
jgi:hypothetical protein